MSVFAAADWFEIRGRGWAASIAGIEGFDPRPLTGQQVEIDGIQYTVRGVEWDLVSSIGKPFALLVGERKVQISASGNQTIDLHKDAL